MKLMMRWLLSVVCVAAWNVALAENAAEGEAKKPEAAPHEKVEVPLASITISGVVTKIEKTGKEGKMISQYQITEASGDVIPLPAPKQQKKEAPSGMAISLDDVLNAQTKITGLGRVVEKNGKKKTMIKSILTIEKLGDAKPVDAPKAEAPKADAATPPPAPK